MDDEMDFKAQSGLNLHPDLLDAIQHRNPLHVPGDLNPNSVVDEGGHYEKLGTSFTENTTHRAGKIARCVSHGSVVCHEVTTRWIAKAIQRVFKLLRQPAGESHSPAGTPFILGVSQADSIPVEKAGTARVSRNTPRCRMARQGSRGLACQGTDAQARQLHHGRRNGYWHGHWYRDRNWHWNRHGHRHWKQAMLFPL